MYKQAKKKSTTHFTRPSGYWNQPLLPTPPS